MVFNGPAGTGKTTLAKLICQILNFELLIINTSAERSGQELIKKIENFLSRGASIVSYQKSKSKVVHNLRLVILDEADGVIASENDSPISVLIEKIFKKDDKCPIGKYPLIFICNNLYVKGLRALRDNSEIFTFRRDLISVKERVFDIVKLENLLIQQ